MAAVIAVNVWRGLPFFAITVLAGLVAVPREFYEAAEVDGASSWGRFWHVTLPLHQAGARGGDPLLDHLHLRRLQHRLRADPRRADEHHPSLRHPRLPGRPQRAATSARAPPSRSSSSRSWRGGVLPAPLHPEGVTVAIGAGAAAPGSGRTLFTYANLAPVRLLRALPLLFHVRHVVQVERGAVQPQVDPVLDPDAASITDHYALLFLKTDFLIWMKNSLIISVVATGGLDGHLHPGRLQPGAPALPRGRLLRHRRLHHLPGPAHPALPPAVAGGGLARDLATRSAR